MATASTQNKNARQSPRTHRVSSQNTKLSSTHSLGLIALRQSRLIRDNNAPTLPDSLMPTRIGQCVPGGWLPHSLWRPNPLAEADDGRESWLRVHHVG